MYDQEYLYWKYSLAFYIFCISLPEDGMRFYYRMLILIRFLLFCLQESDLESYLGVHVGIRRPYTDTLNTTPHYSSGQSPDTRQHTIRCEMTLSAPDDHSGGKHIFDSTGPIVVSTGGNLSSLDELEAEDLKPRRESASRVDEFFDGGSESHQAIISHLPPPYSPTHSALRQYPQPSPAASAVKQEPSLFDDVFAPHPTTSTCSMVPSTTEGTESPGYCTSPANRGFSHQQGGYEEHRSESVAGTFGSSYEQQSNMMSYDSSVNGLCNILAVSLSGEPTQQVFDNTGHSGLSQSPGSCLSESPMYPPTNSNLLLHSNVPHSSASCEPGSLSVSINSVIKIDPDEGNMKFSIPRNDTPPSYSSWPTMSALGGCGSSVSPTAESDSTTSQQFHSYSSPEQLLLSMGNPSSTDTSPDSGIASQFPQSFSSPPDIFTCPPAISNVSAMLPSPTSGQQRIKRAGKVRHSSQPAPPKTSSLVGCRTKPSRRDNPELEKRRVHHCDYPG